MQKYKETNVKAKILRINFKRKNLYRIYSIKVTLFKILEFPYESLDTPTARIVLVPALANNQSELVYEVESLITLHKEREVIPDADLAEPYLNKQPLFFR